MSITDLTKDCPREDCCIQNMGSSMTLIGWSPIFDKHGNPKGRDPNSTINDYRCWTCKAEWRVTSRDGEADVIKKTEPAP